MTAPGIGTCKLEALKVPMIADPGDKWEYGIKYTAPFAMLLQPSTIH